MQYVRKAYNGEDTEPKDFIRLIRAATSSRRPHEALHSLAVSLLIYVHNHNAPNHSALLVELADHLAANTKYRSDPIWMSAVEAYDSLGNDTYRQKAREAWKTEYDKGDSISQAHMIIATQERLTAMEVPRNDPFVVQTDKLWAKIPDNYRTSYLQRHLQSEERQSRNALFNTTHTEKQPEEGLTATAVERFIPEFETWSKQTSRGR